ncbi:MAG: hypothetical protein JNL72_15870 [Flavipsychrobacter sp.]|nr:hypothetical protein [Flavipsychrobacter sp.]
MNKGFLASVLVVFVLLNAVLYFLSPQMAGFDMPALYAGNALMLVVALISFLLVSRQIAARPQAFIRGVYSSTYLKLFVCVAGILIYVLARRPHVHKPSIFALLGIYAAYTIVETIFVSKLARKTK